MTNKNYITGNTKFDPSRIYITGLSMGGFGTWDLMARWPDRIAAAMPICGGADLATAERIKHVPVWVFHGSADTAVKTKRRLLRCRSTLSFMVMAKASSVDVSPPGYCSLQTRYSR